MLRIRTKMDSCMSHIAERTLLANDPTLPHSDIAMQPTHSNARYVHPHNYYVSYRLVLKLQDFIIAS